MAAVLAKNCRGDVWEWLRANVAGFGAPRHQFIVASFLLKKGGGFVSSEVAGEGSF